MKSATIMAAMLMTVSTVQAHERCYSSLATEFSPPRLLLQNTRFIGRPVDTDCLTAFLQARQRPILEIMGTRIPLRLELDVPKSKVDETVAALLKGRPDSESLTVRYSADGSIRITDEYDGN